MSDNTLRVKSAVVDKRHVIFYGEDGRTHKIEQGDPRLHDLMAELSPRLARGEIVPISLDKFSVYEEFTKKTGGFVSFFKAAKNKLASFFRAPEPEPEITLAPEELTIEEPKVTTGQPVVHKQPRYDDIKEHLTPIDGNEKPSDSIVAVINGVVIPGIEQLTPYIRHALAHNSEMAVKNFLQRCAAMVDQRMHSVEDMFKFLERGDLPLAEDGSIIAYKVLRSTTEHGHFTYVDCHSRKVHQRVGTEVRVPERLVDKNRRNECSNGLHIARRGYIGGFSGDVCVMIKLAPEDVITVPHGDYNKVRVMGYHVIFELPREVYQVLRSNKPMTNNKIAKRMLTSAITGDHIPVLEQVWINGQMGSNLSVKSFVETPDTSIPEPVEEAAEKAVALDTIESTGKAVDPVALQKEERAIKKSAKKTKETKEPVKAAKPAPKAKSKPATKSEPKKGKPVNRVGFVKTKKGYTPVDPVTRKPIDKAEPKKKLTKAEEARSIYNDWINASDDNKLAELKAFQKKAKKGWKVLGFDDEEIALITA